MVKKKKRRKAYVICYCLHKEKSIYLCNYVLNVPRTSEKMAAGVATGVRERFTFYCISFVLSGFYVMHMLPSF